MIFSSKVYDVLKFVALVVLPALAGLCLTVFQTWGLDHGDQIATTIVAIDTFLGVLLGISSRQWSINPANVDGYLTQTGVHPDTGMANLSMTLNKTPDELMGKKVVNLRVGTPPPPPQIVA